MASATENRSKISTFGKVLRIMRMDRGELLKDMAQKIGVTSAYLSAVENGNKKPTLELVEKICRIYDLNKDQAQELEDAYRKSLMSVVLDFHNVREDQQLLGLKLARAFSSLSPSQIKKISDVIKDKT